MTLLPNQTKLHFLPTNPDCTAREIADGGEQHNQDRLQAHRAKNIDTHPSIFYRLFGELHVVCNRSQGHLQQVTRQLMDLPTCPYKRH
ncbi:hypothetical protein CgunFtcFv8_018524 [Champsocephalus gunnari]|uniref:Uncharacterized protein n=1 Tax=Champsocephalus gunnari TaxID=52237 RepID=A0AAN8BTL2_CHAGU|nr:hypothetical protein CgunFtcFv8_018524 [Champsocephalus gunnari]